MRIDKIDNRIFIANKAYKINMRTDIETVDVFNDIVNNKIIKYKGFEMYLSSKRKVELPREFMLKVFNKGVFDNSTTAVGIHGHRYDMWYNGSDLEKLGVNYISISEEYNPRDIKDFDTIYKMALRLKEEWDNVLDAPIQAILVFGQAFMLDNSFIQKVSRYNRDFEYSQKVKMFRDGGRGAKSKTGRIRARAMESDILKGVTVMGTDYFKEM